MTDNPTPATVEAVALDDDFDDALRAFHHEAFFAGVCYERDEWPQDDEERRDVSRSIQSEAVGEHYEGWKPETAAKLIRAVLASPAIAAKDARIAELEAGNARLRETLEKVKPECGLGCRGEYDDGRCGLNGGLPCCTVRLALRAAVLAAAGKKEEGRVEVSNRSDAIRREYTYCVTKIVMVDYGKGPEAPLEVTAQLAVIPDGSHWAGRPQKLDLRIAAGELVCGDLVRLTIERIER